MHYGLKMKERIRQQVFDFISNYEIDIAHDIFHLDRVCNNCLFLNEKENHKKDEPVLILSSYLHDFHRLSSGNDSKLKKVEESEELLYNFFQKNSEYKNYRNEVISLVSATDKYSFSDDKQNKSKIDIKAKILFDADSLEALGAIGIARAFSFGQWIEEPIYNPQFPLKDDTFYQAKKTHSVLHHFYEKLFKLENEFYTETAKKIAKERTEFTRLYIKIFLEEISL
ncbi:putative hydrolase [Candidatus Ornithobacterium hominis]|nr:putative hydrolase [Candidatus Ornithobacterium hominis]